MDYGLKKFLNVKEVPINIALELFKTKENFTGNKPQLIEYIQLNWGKFSTFIDYSIKNNVFHGKRVKLNTFYSEKNKKIKEYKQFFTVLSEQEQFILKTPHTDFGKTHSFIARRGFKIPCKDVTFTNKLLQNMPIILLLRENELISELYGILLNK